MASALIVLAPGAEEIETITVGDLLVRAGVEVVVGHAEETVVAGSRGLPLAGQRPLDDGLERDWDLVYLPGGLGSADYACTDERVQGLLERQLGSGRWLAIICASPRALVPRGLARDRRVTCYPGLREQVEPGVGSWVDAPVVRDGNLVTSQGPGTAAALGLVCAGLLVGTETARSVAAAALLPVPDDLDALCHG